MLPKPVAGIREIDNSIAGNVQGIGEFTGNAIGRGGQNGNLSPGIDGEQPLAGIADDQILVLVELKAQGPTVGVGENYLGETGSGVFLNSPNRVPVESNSRIISFSRTKSK